MYIDGIGISGFRSFGSTHQFVGPLGKINLLIGQNNSGKSNILVFLKNHYIPFITKGKLKCDDLDRHIGATSGKVEISIGLNINGEKTARYIADPNLSRIRAFLMTILKSDVLTGGGAVAWFRFEAETLNAPFKLSRDMIEEVKKRISPRDHYQWQNVWGALTGHGGGDLSDWVGETLERLSNLAKSNIGIELIPAVRSVGVAGTEPQDYSGAGLIDRLAKLQNPGPAAQGDKKRFEEINKFLRTVVGNDSAKLEIPYERNMILVHMDGKTLPLSYLGTGVHEVVILAAAATVIKDQILCIEEPELHLHPLLQRKLIRYLNDKTSNQYFITTHSAHILDTPSAGVFHVRHQSGQSTVEHAITDDEKTAICSDLGYFASDIMQANSIVWVEGPSDRIYINHWLRALDPTLIEGLHYSIMFYGGRLLSHLSAEDPEVGDFISLRKLNRHIAIVIDSDCSRASDVINETKARIRREFDDGPGFAWITQGREIENYLDPETLKTAILKIHKNAETVANFSQFANNLKYKNKDGKYAEADKVKIAHAVANSQPNFDILDLKSQMDKIVNFIRDANDFNES